MHAQARSVSTSSMKTGSPSSDILANGEIEAINKQCTALPPCLSTQSITARVSAERRDDFCGVCLEDLPSVYNRWFTTSDFTKVQVMHCCGKLIHGKCYYRLLESTHDKTCVFCRSELKTSEEDIGPLALSAGKDRPWVHFARGVVLAKDGGIEKALSSFKISAEAGYAEASFYLAQYYHRHLNNEDALKWYLKASESKDPDMLFHLVRFLNQNGEALQTARIQCLLHLAADQDHCISNELLLRGCHLPHPIVDVHKKHLLLKTASLGSDFALHFLLEREDLLRDLLLSFDCKSIFLGITARRRLYARCRRNAPFAHYLIGRTLLSYNIDESGDRFRPLALFWLKKAQASIYDSDATAKAAIASEINALLSTAKALCSGCKLAVQTKTVKVCNQCHCSFYCSRNCFLSHWKKDHKYNCLPKIKGSASSIDSSAVLSRTERAMVEIFPERIVDFQHPQQSAEFQERVRPGRRSLNDMCSSISEAYS